MHLDSGVTNPEFASNGFIVHTVGQAFEDLMLSLRQCCIIQGSFYYRLQ